jgi:hypothetical protein
MKRALFVLTLCAILPNCVLATPRPEVRPAGLVCEVNTYTLDGYLATVETSPGQTTLGCAEAQIIADKLNERNYTGEHPVLAVVSALN